MEAYLYDSGNDNEVHCRLCAHKCTIKNGKRGICRVRENRSGKLETLVYGKLIAWHVDPIEKKPLFHLMPGSRSYSIATMGCNFKCRFCQNSDISQVPGSHGPIPGRDATPQQVVNAAIESRCQSIAFTYTEPTIYFEFAYETARIAHENGLKNVFVTNGYMSREALEMVAPYLDAANVDLKAFRQDFYKTWCGAKLKPVTETLVRMKQLGIMVEVTTLLIPGLNDDEKELTELANFIAQSLGRETPWHISRFHPTYQLLDVPVTPVDSLAKARQIGIQAGLQYVYTGNVPGNEGENTFCPSCGRVVIHRWQYTIGAMDIQDGKCGHCGAEIYGIGM